MSAHEMIDESRKVLPSIDQPRHIDTVCRERVEERREPARRRLTQLMRRRGDQPYVRHARFPGTRTASIPFEHGVQGLLKVGWQFLNRIEKHRTA